MIETSEQAAEILNKHKWRERDDWQLEAAPDFEHPYVQSNPGEAPLYELAPEDAIAIACYLELSESSPILGFEGWVTQYVKGFRLLTPDEYGIAYAAFIAAHPGKGSNSHVMAEFGDEL